MKKIFKAIKNIKITPDDVAIIISILSMLITTYDFLNKP